MCGIPIKVLFCDSLSLEHSLLLAATSHRQAPRVGLYCSSPQPKTFSMSSCMQAAGQQVLAPGTDKQQHAEQQAQIEYAIHMRQLFSPPGMLHADGSINQEFFRPKKVVTLADRKWGDAEREQLYRGLEKYGVGKWRQMAEDMLKGWDDNNIRLKAAKLLGCQNLSRYYGRCISRAEVDAELELNKQLGAQTGCWKNGMLVDNDKGTLAAHFRQQAQQMALHEQQHQPMS